MTGITNAGVGGGGGSAFLAYLQIATDPNAVITAVNLAGDTFSGTADSTGSLVMDITEPGTYTVTETDGGNGTIVIADNGVTYTIEVNAFSGALIENGAEVYGNFEAVGISYGNYTPAAPTITDTTYTSSGITYNVKRIYAASGTSGVYRTTIYIDTSVYEKLKLKFAVSNQDSANVSVRFKDTESENAWNASIWYGDNFTTDRYYPRGYFPAGSYEVGITVVDGASIYLNEFAFE